MTYIYIYIYICRTAPLTCRCCILYIYSTNICTEYFEHAAHSPFFFSSKSRLFHNASFFGSCVIHILYTDVPKFKKKKKKSGAKGLKSGEKILRISHEGLPKYVLLPATLNHHKNAFFNWNCIRRVAHPSVCPPIFPHASTWLPLYRFLWNLIVGAS